jgi:hypothetical protein
LRAGSSLPGRVTEPEKRRVVGVFEVLIVPRDLDRTVFAEPGFGI